MHDLNMAARFCDRLVLLNEGNIICDGDVDSVLTTENLAAVYGIQARLDKTIHGNITVIPEGRIAHQ